MFSIFKMKQKSNIKLHYAGSTSRLYNFIIIQLIYFLSLSSKSI